MVRLRRVRPGGGGAGPGSPGLGLEGLVEGADVGAGRDDLVDAVEDVVGEGDVQAGELSKASTSSCASAKREHIQLCFSLTGQGAHRPGAGWP